MATNPRNKVSFIDTIPHQNILTFLTDNTINRDATVKGATPQVGLAAKIVGHQTVGLATSGPVYGFVVNVELGEFAAIQTHGTARAKAASSAALAGKYLVAGAGGTVTASGNAGADVTNLLALENPVQVGTDYFVIVQFV